MKRKQKIIKPRIVPYSSAPLIGCRAPTSWKRITLDNGATVAVGAQLTAIDTRYVHVFERNKTPRTRTKLIFALSPEACVALVQLYIAHGVFGKPGKEWK